MLEQDRDSRYILYSQKRRNPIILLHNTRPASQAASPASTASQSPGPASCSLLSTDLTASLLVSLVMDIKKAVEMRTLANRSVSLNRVKLLRKEICSGY